ncbi:MAG: AsmA family protein [Xanthobacteraceae bacterium]|uniref:AsmA family protein n=1 Tax=Pseudolabrys sp. TaxID=1960880 RepID=UPI003D10E9AC
MQTTLIGLAIALILALVTALVGPFVVDWNDYRALFEKEASRLAGIDVRVHGKIDGRLLPSPQISLKDVEIGRANAGGIRADSLDIEFALGSLMRGEWRAAEMRLAGPSIHLGLDAGGRVQAPSLALNFDPQALSIDRLSIVNGTLTLSDAASSHRVQLDKIWFNGDVRSLLGPLRGEGAFSYNGTLFPYRVTAGRYGGDGTLKLHLNVDPSDVAMAMEVDGTLFLAGLAPRFEGAMTVARPVGIAQGGPKAGLTPPWRVGSKVKISQKQALLEQIDFSYGSGEDAVHLFGTADMTFGARPRLNGVMSGRQIDLDRVLTGGDAAPGEPPAVLIRKLVATAAAAIKPDFPVSLGVGVDLITLGGASIQNLRGDVSSRDGGWLLDRFEFRAPGLTQVRLSGRVALEDNAVTFKGPADVTSGDPRLLATWLQGGKPAATASPRQMRARGDLTIGATRIAIDGMRAEFAGEAVTGRLAYNFAAAGKPARLDTELKAPQLDIDAVQGFVSALAQGGPFERPREVSLSLDIGRATMAGYEAKQASLQMHVGEKGLELDKLSVADFGGASIAARGTIALEGKPGGRVTLDLNARDLGAVTAAIGKFAPEVAGRLRESAPMLAPARLQSTLTVESTASAVNAGVVVTGTAGTLTVNLDGQATTAAPQVSLTSLAAADIRIKGKFDAKDNVLLARFLGLDHLLATARGVGQLTFDASGSSSKDVTLAGRWTAKDVDIALDGRMASPLGGETKAAKASMTLKVARADLSGLRGGLAMLAEPLPVALTSKVAVAGPAVRFDDIAGTIAGHSVRGRLAVERGTARKVSGDLNVGSIDVAALVAAGAGFPPQLATGAGWSWPGDPFGAPQLDGYSGSIAIHAPVARLTPDWQLRGFSAAVRFDDKTFALDNVSGRLAGGQFDGALKLRRGVQGLAAEAKLALKGVDAASLTPGAVRAPVAGRLGLTLTAEGSGLSPATLIGSLNGSGVITLEDARLAGLDPRVFEAVADAADNAKADAKQLANLAGRALDAGNLSVRKAQADISLSAGQLRVNNVSLQAEGADASLSGRFDLNDGSIDARIALSGAVESGMRPNLFVALRGPAAAPLRSIDASALTGWLTMKAIERHARELKKLEAERAREDARRAEERENEKAQAERAKMDAERIMAPSVPPAAAPSLPPPMTIAPAPAPKGKPAPRAQSAPPLGLAPASQ